MYHALQQFSDELHWYCSKCKGGAGKLLAILSSLQSKIDKLEDEIVRSKRDWKADLVNSSAVLKGDVTRLDHQVAANLKNMEEEMVKMKSEHLSELTKVRSEMHNMDSRQKVEECKGKIDKIVADIVQLGDRVEHCEHRPDVTSELDEEDKRELWSDIVSRSKEVEQKISGVTDDVMILKQQTTEIREDRDEQCEIDKRRNCAIIQGLPEPTGDDGVNRKKQDEERIIDMLHEIQCDDVSVNTVIRLGRLPEADAKPRPVKIVLASEAQKEKVLSKAKNLKSKGSRGLDKIYIHQDRTPKQRRKRQQLVKELKDRQTAGEKDLVIVNYRIVTWKPRTVSED
jgi:hypothetical protein